MAIAGLVLALVADTFGDLPSTGVANGQLALALDSGLLYRRNTSGGTWDQVAPSSGSLVSSNMADVTAPGTTDEETLYTIPLTDAQLPQNGGWLHLTATVDLPAATNNLVTFRVRINGALIAERQFSKGSAAAVHLVEFSAQVGRVSNTEARGIAKVLENRTDGTALGNHRYGLIEVTSLDLAGGSDVMTLTVQKALGSDPVIGKTLHTWAVRS